MGGLIAPVLSGQLQSAPVMVLTKKISDGAPPKKLGWEDGVDQTGRIGVGEGSFPPSPVTGFL